MWWQHGTTSSNSDDNNHQHHPHAKMLASSIQPIEAKDILNTLSLSYGPSHPLYELEQKQQQVVQRDAMRVHTDHRLKGEQRLLPPKPSGSRIHDPRAPARTTLTDPRSTASKPPPSTSPPLPLQPNGIINTTTPSSPPSSSAPRATPPRTPITNVPSRGLTVSANKPQTAPATTPATPPTHTTQHSSSQILSNTPTETTIATTTTFTATTTTKVNTDKAAPVARVTTASRLLFSESGTHDFSSSSSSSLESAAMDSASVVI